MTDFTKAIERIEDELTANPLHYIPLEERTREFYPDSRTVTEGEHVLLKVGGKYYDSDSVRQWDWPPRRRPYNWLWDGL